MPATRASSRPAAANTNTNAPTTTATPSAPTATNPPPPPPTTTTKPSNLKPSNPKPKKAKAAKAKKQPAPPPARSDGDLAVSAIVESKAQKNGKVLFRVRWEGFGDDTDSWLTRDDLRSAGYEVLLAKFEGVDPPPPDKHEATAAATAKSEGGGGGGGGTKRGGTERGGGGREGGGREGSGGGIKGVRFNENIYRKQQNAVTGDWFEEESFINDNPSTLDDS